MNTFIFIVLLLNGTSYELCSTDINDATLRANSYNTQVSTVTGSTDTCVDGWANEFADDEVVDYDDMGNEIYASDLDYTDTVMNISYNNIEE